MDLLDLKKILVIRTDRIGDVVLSTPVLTALKSRYPQSHVTMMVRPYTREIVEGHPDVDEILVFDERVLSDKVAYRSFVREIRNRRFDAAITVYPTFRLARLIYASKIPVRLGTGYRWYSILFNRRVYEHRKLSLRHELEYNLRMLQKIGVPYPEMIDFKFNVPESALQRARDWFTSNSIDPTRDKIVLVHPGSGGSALDWPLEKFAAFSDALNQIRDVKVILTGGPNEHEVVDKVYQLTQSRPMRAVGIFSIKEMAAFIRLSHLFVANSTGPLHIAVAVGTEVIGFFCPLVPCLPQRWGPYGRIADSVLMPEVDACKKCTRKGCKNWNCMEMISVENAMHMAKNKLKVEA
ncbi:MAG: glycosyltransferase family 9 protein [Candidatus Zhuqueibacterota bacterium]